MKLSIKAFSLACGITSGIVVFAATLCVVLKGGGEHLVLLQQFFPGYGISIGGAFLGLAYGFVTGLISGLIFTALYNVFSGKCCEPEGEKQPELKT